MRQVCVEQQARRTFQIKGYISTEEAKCVWGWFTVSSTQRSQDAFMFQFI